MHQKGQTQIVPLAVGIIVVFVVLAIGMVIVSNVSNYSGTPIDVPFNSLWPLVVAGVAIIALIIGLAKMASG